MNIKAVEAILKLNRDFYQSIAAEFSKSRQKPWAGWNRAVAVTITALGAVDAKNIKVLDLGCGNGRFYNFISKKIDVTYLGLDMNNDLIRIAKSKYKSPKVSFEKKDIFLDIKKITGKYNIISAFGVTHHIPNSTFRLNWFKQLPNLLAAKGVLILSFWEFEKKPGDYLLGWAKKGEVYRYCHQYSDKELEQITNTYTKLGLKLLDKYKSDNENLYLLFGTI